MKTKPFLIVIMGVLFIGWGCSFDLKAQDAEADDLDSTEITDKDKKGEAAQDEDSENKKKKDIFHAVDDISKMPFGGLEPGTYEYFNYNTGKLEQVVYGRLNDSASYRGILPTSVSDGLMSGAIEPGIYSSQGTNYYFGPPAQRTLLQRIYGNSL